MPSVSTLLLGCDQTPILRSAQTRIANRAACIVCFGGAPPFNTICLTSALLAKTDVAIPVPKSFLGHSRRLTPYRRLPLHAFEQTSRPDATDVPVVPDTVRRPLAYLKRHFGRADLPSGVRYFLKNSDIFCGFRLSRRDRTLKCDPDIFEARVGLIPLHNVLVGDLFASVSI